MKYLLIILLSCMCIFLPLSGRSRKSLGKNFHHETTQAVPSNIIPDSTQTPTPTPPAAASSSVQKSKPSSSHAQKSPTQQESDESQRIFLNFNNAELMSFVKYVAGLKKIGIYADKSVEGSKISLNIKKPLTFEQAWKTLLTVAEMAGFSIVRVGDLCKVLPKDRKNTQPLPAYINIPAERLPDSDVNIRYVTFLNNIKVQNVRGLLESMLGTPHLVIPQESVNGIIISDTAYNIKAAMKIIQELDTTGLQESATIIQLHQANASEVHTLLESLKGEKQEVHPLARLLGRHAETSSSYFTQGTKIIAIENLNRLLILGTKEATEKIRTFVEQHIDKKYENIESPLHVYELQHTNAKQVADILKEATAQPESIAGQQAAKYGAIRGGVKYFKNMTIKADEDGNRVIVATSDKNDWKLLKETIKNLDKPQPEVVIEALIVTVDMTNNRGLGGQIRNKKHGQVGKGINYQTPPINKTVFETDNSNNPVSLLGNMISGLQGGLGQTLLTFGRDTNIWGIMRMLQEQKHTSVVAQPFLTVANKYQSKIAIGTTKRQTAQTSLASGGSTPITGQRDVSANLELNISPQINIDGVINLKIKVNINEFVGDSSDETLQRILDTSVSIANGQVLALGGLVKTKVVEGVSKTPIIGDIPGFGWLFKNKTKEVTKENVLVFLSPTIIKPRSTEGINLYTRIKLNNAKKDLGRSSMGDTLRTDPISHWFFDNESKSYVHKIDDFASARYQPVTVDIKNDDYYRATHDDHNGTFKKSSHKKKHQRKQKRRNKK